MSIKSRLKNSREILDDTRNLLRNQWSSPFLFDTESEVWCSYLDFFSYVWAWKDCFEEMGIKSGDVLCIVMKNSVTLVYIYFAALLSGVIVMPIDPLRGRKEIEDIIHREMPNFLLLSRTSRVTFEFAKYIEDISPRLSVTVSLNCIDEKFAALLLDIPFLITFTTGSTGHPKGVIHSFGNLIQSAYAFQKEFDFNTRNIFYHNLPMAYMAGILNLIILPFISGSKIIIGNRFSISEALVFWEVPRRLYVNTFWFTPTILALLLKFDRGTVGEEYMRSHMCVGCVGTAPLPLVTRNTFEERYGIQLYESYGLSETLFVSTQSPLTISSQNSCAGAPLEGVHLSFGKDREIYIDTPWMFFGYTHDKNISRPYPSGDIGELQDGSLCIYDRKKDIIIRGGLNMSPKKIEELASSSQLCEECVVIGMPDTILGEKVVCFFVPRPAISIHVFQCEMRRLVTDILGALYTIDEFVVLSGLPKNINGKIDKIQLKTMFSYDH